MTYNQFEELREDFQDLYQNQEYDLAFELASQHTQIFPERWPLIMYWRISSAARAGRLDQAVSVLDEFLDLGYWYGDILLRENPALEPLQELPAYDRLVQRNQQIKAQDQSSIYPILMIRPQGECQKEGNECPLLIGLHGNASTARDSLDFWSPAGIVGWLVAAPQSSQAVWKDAYVWDDLDFARREIDSHLSKLEQQYAVDPDRIILAGHDVGAETALWLALKDPIKYTGFLLIGLNGPLSENPGNWQKLVDEYQERQPRGTQGLRGYIIIGEQDQVSPSRNIPPLIDILADAGISCKMEKMKGLGHSYASRNDPALLRGLDYISGLL